MEPLVKPTILFIPRWYPSEEDEMLGLFIKHHAEAIPNDYQVIVLYIHSSFTKNHTFYSTNKNTRVYGKFIRIYKNRLLAVFNPIKYLLATIGLWYTIKKKHPHIHLVHVHVLTRTGLLALWLKFSHGIPYLITEHWSRYLPQNSQSFNGLLRKKLTAFIVKHANYVTTVTGALSEGMKWNGLTNENYTLIPNVVDTSRFTIKEQASAMKTGFLNVGCFDEQAKNNFGLLRAIKKLSQFRQDFEFIFVGTGVDWQRTVKYAEDLGIPPECVQFTGELVGDELVHQYQKCNAFVLFSHYETQGVVLLEAFACGKPVIATNVGGIPEIMSEDRGVLVEPSHEEELVNAMTQVMEGKVFAPPLTIRKYAEMHFGQEVIGHKFKQLYQTMLIK